MNRAKNRRIYYKNANTLNFNIFSKIKKNIYKTKCFRENKYNEPIKYVTKETQCCSGNKLDENPTDENGRTFIKNSRFVNRFYNPPKIQRIYKDPKSQCKDICYRVRKRTQNRKAGISGCYDEKYNYSSGNYLHKLKQRMKNEKLIKKSTKNNSRQTHFFVKNTNMKEKYQKTKLNNCDISNCTNWINNNKKVRTGGNHTQKLAYTTSLIADIKKKYTPNVSYAMDYTNTYPKQNPYPCYNSRQDKRENKFSPTKGIPIVGTYVKIKNLQQEGIVIKVNYNMLSGNTYNILLNDQTQVEEHTRNDIEILDERQHLKDVKKNYCYTKKNKCNPCKLCN